MSRKQDTNSSGAGKRGPGQPFPGTYPQELPLPRSLPASGEVTPRQCPPQDDRGAGPFYCRG